MQTVYLGNGSAVTITAYALRVDHDDEVHHIPVSPQQLRVLAEAMRATADAEQCKADQAVLERIRATEGDDGELPQ